MYYRVQRLADVAQKPVSALAHVIAGVAGPGVKVIVNSAAGFWNQYSVKHQRKLNMPHTEGDWEFDDGFIVAATPGGPHPNIYLAEMVHTDETGRYEHDFDKLVGNGRLMAAAKRLLAAAEYTLNNLDVAANEQLITSPRYMQVQLGESRKLLRNAILSAQAPLEPESEQAPEPVDDGTAPLNRYDVEALEKFVVRTHYTGVEAANPALAVAFCRGGMVAYDSQSIEEGDEEWLETVSVTLAEPE